MKRLIAVVSIAVSLIAMACRNDEESQVMVDSIKFAESEKTIAVGDVVAVGMNVLPEEAKANITVAYSVTQQGIVNIVSTSNDGVVLEAVSRGSVVVVGKAEGMVDYLSITVSSGSENMIPHIVSPIQVVEVPLGQRRSITVSLAGGSPLDNNNFLWSYTGQRTINLESTGNVCVFDAIELGEAVITVAHPRAMYPVDILVYVIGINEVPVYITTDKPVITVDRDAVSANVLVSLNGGSQSDESGFVWEVADGRDVINLTATERRGTIYPVKAGTALIEVSHRKAAHKLKIQVIVNEKLEFNFINLDKSFLMLGTSDHAVVRAVFSGSSPNDVLYKYRYELIGDDIVDIVHTNDQFSVATRGAGSVVMKIYNEYADFPREVLIVAYDINTGIIDNQKYITTSQNVVMMEVGQGDSILRMLLVGGNEADRNGFTWWVDNSDIVEVNTSFGTVKENQIPPRAIIQGVYLPELEATAVLTPKKAGTARIFVQHGKSRHEASVLVKVYPKGTFAAVPVVLSGPSHLRIKKGESSNIILGIETGNSNNLGTVEWSIDKLSVASVNGAGLSGIIEAKEVGIGKLTVSGGNLKTPYTAVVAVYDDNEEPKYIFTASPYVSMAVGQSIMVQVESRGLSAGDINSLVLSNSNASVVTAAISRGAVMLNAVAKGTAELVITGNAENQVRIVVMVEDPQVDIDYPYYLTVDRNIVGIENGKSETLSVNLVGGGDREYNAMVWSSSNEQVVQVISHGKTATVSARGTGQAVVRVSHPKSVNRTLDIVVYVTDGSGGNKVVLYAEQTHYFIERGERVFFTIRTNATTAERNNIRWSIDDDEVASMTMLDDKISVYVEGLSRGVSRISVSHANNVIPQTIYVSVVDSKSGIKYIDVPSLLEAVTGNNINITAVAQGLSNSEITGLVWEVDNNSIATVVGTGLFCLVQPKQSGMAVISLKQNDIGFRKDIRLYVYSSYAEMANSYVMSFESSYYRVGVGDAFDVSLVFGTKGFPEHEIPNISWSVSEGGVAQITGYGKKVNVRAVNQGIATVTAVSNVARFNSVSFQVEVVSQQNISGEYRLQISENDRIKGIVVGRFADIGVRLFKGTTEVPIGVNDIECVVEQEGLVRVTRTQNNVRLTAQAAGQSYVVFKHSLAENVRIFIHTGTESEVANYFPVTFDSNNYLMRVDESVTIHARTPENPEKIALITWRNETNSGAVRFAEMNHREIRVSASQRGNDTIAVLYNGAVVQRLYISVTDNAVSDFSAFIVTESVIGMVMDKDYTARITTNIPEYLLGMIVWESENQNIVKLKDFHGSQATLQPVAAGQAYVSVKFGSTERKILVFVCESEAQLPGYKAANIDNRYHVIKKGDTISVSLFAYGGSLQGTTAFRDHFSYNGNYSGVVEVTQNGNGSVRVMGLEEGIAAIRVTNDYYGAEIVVYVEVHKKSSGSQNNTSSQFYMSTRQMAYIIESNDEAPYILIDINGDNFTHYAFFEWAYDNSYIDILASGNGGYIHAKMPDTTIVKVSNPYIENSLEILVIVGERYTMQGTGSSYIYADRTIVEMGIDSPSQVVKYELINMPNIAYSDITIEIDGSSVTVNSRTEGRITVNAIAIGMTKVTLSYQQNIKTELYFIVRQGEVSSSVYLTTSENFVIGGLHDIRTVNVRLVGYSEMDSNNFKWSVKDESIARIVGNGSVAQVYGLKEGETTITVGHVKIPQEYWLVINLKISSNRNEQAVYLTTQTNVIETVATNVATNIYVQKIGGNPSNRTTTWTVDDPTVLTVTGSEFTGMFTPKKAGVARITVVNSEIDKRPLNIVVIVREPSGTGMYIALPQRLIMLRPGTLNYRVTASLVGGSDLDNSDFEWHIRHSSPTSVEVAQAQGNVITILPAGNQCNITAVNDGVAEIRVSHRKSDVIGYITVQVTRYNELSFKRDSIELEEGQSEFVAMNVPTYDNFYDRILFSSDNPDVVAVMGVRGSSLIQAKSKGNAIVRAWIAGKEQIAELYVSVVEEHNPNVTRIITAKTIYSMNPRSPVEKIEARLHGLSVIDQMNDELRWYPAYGLDKSPEISLFPAATHEDDYGQYAEGRDLQIGPRAIGVATVTVGHPMIDQRYWKTIIFIVDEHSDALTLDKDQMLIRSDNMGTLRATIIGGRVSDYEEIAWVADWMPWNGDYIEIVRVMGQGREISLVPNRTDGEVLVTAVYKQHVKQCLVKVEAAQVFTLAYRSIRIHPGQPFEVPYVLRPVNATITWMGGREDVPIGSPVLGQIIASYSDRASDKYLNVYGENEGQTTISGFASQNAGAAQLQVVVRWDYELFADVSARGTPMTRDNDPPIEINYRLYPAVCRVKVVPGTIPNHINYEVLPPDPQTGKGKVLIYVREEISNMAVELQLYTPEDTPLDYKTTTMVSASFEGEELRPFFYQYLGVWSNAEVETNNRGLTTPRQQEMYTSMLMPNGLPNAYTIRKAAEQSVPINKAKNDVGPYDLYMVLGDGDDHTILFDKKFEISTANVTIKIPGVTSGEPDAIVYRQDATSTSYNNSRMWNEIKSKYGVDVTPTNTQINGINIPGIRLSGGVDQILYDRVAFDHQLWVDHESNNAVTGTSTGPGYDIVPYYIGQVAIPVRQNSSTDHENLWLPGTGENGKSRYLYDFNQVFMFTEAEYQAIIRNSGNNREQFVKLLDYDPDFAGSVFVGELNYVWLTTVQQTYVGIRDTAEGTQNYPISGFDHWQPRYRWGYKYQVEMINNENFAEYFVSAPQDGYKELTENGAEYRIYPEFQARIPYTSTSYRDKDYFVYNASDLSQIRDFNEADFSKAFWRIGQYSFPPDATIEEENIIEELRNEALLKIDASKVIFGLTDNSRDEEDNPIYTVEYRFSEYTYSKNVTRPSTRSDIASWNVFKNLGYFNNAVNNAAWDGTSRVRIKDLGTFWLSGANTVKYLEYDGVKRTSGFYYQYYKEETRRYHDPEMTRRDLYNSDARLPSEIIDLFLEVRSDGLVYTKSSIPNVPPFGLVLYEAPFNLLCEITYGNTFEGDNSISINFYPYGDFKPYRFVARAGYIWLQVYSGGLLGGQWNTWGRFPGGVPIHATPVVQIEWKRKTVDFVDRIHEGDNPDMAYWKKISHTYYDNLSEDSTMGRAFLGLDGRSAVTYQPEAYNTNQRSKSGFTLHGRDGTKRQWYKTNQINYDRAYYEGNDYGESNYALLGIGRETGTYNNYNYIGTEFRRYVMQRQYFCDWLITWHRGFWNAGEEKGRKTLSSSHIINSATYVNNRVRWQKTNANYIVPIATLRQFPFVVNVDGVEYNTLKFNDAVGYQAPIDGVTSTPMPSINTGIKNSSNGQQILIKAVVEIRYHGRSDPERYNLWIDYKVRDSHHLYDGKTVGMNFPTEGLGLPSSQDTSTWRDAVTTAYSGLNISEVQGVRAWSVPSGNPSNPTTALLHRQQDGNSLPGHTYRETQATSNPRTFVQPDF